MRCEDARELITGLVDNELSADERGLLDEHIGDCLRCQSAHELELTLKQSVRAASEGLTAPAGLRERILAAGGKSPQGDEAGLASRIRAWMLAPGWRPAFAVTLMILLFFPLYYVLKPTNNIALATIATHQEIKTGEKYKALVPIADMAALKKELVGVVGGRFEPMGFDLSMMQLYPVAGFVRKIGNRDVIVTVYQGKGPGVTCITLLGTESDAPRSAQLFHDAAKNINFYSFSKNGFNGVLHQEGKVICIMLSEMPAADLLALVRAKARQV